MNPVTQALLECSRRDPAIDCFLRSILARRQAQERGWRWEGAYEALVLTEDELAELVRLQSQRWNDAVWTAIKIAERTPAPPLIVKYGHPPPTPPPPPCRHERLTLGICDECGTLPAADPDAGGRT